VVVFTASLAAYADPLLDLLDSTQTVRWRLFREACLPLQVRGNNWLIHSRGYTCFLMPDARVG
jgi:hypothetical protein